MTAFVGASRAPAGSFESRAMQVGGIEVVVDCSRALYVPGERTLVVADLHLEKGSAFAVRGIMLPPYDTRETLHRLAAVLVRYGPHHVVALGDSLHDRSAESRLPAAERSELSRMQAGRAWTWITGNHDPEISAGLGGGVAQSLNLGKVVLRHEPSTGETSGEIAGHLHPTARVVLSGAGMRRPCFIGNANRLVLPAFGAFTGGLNVLDQAFAALFADGRFDVHVLGQNGVYPVARANLAPE